ncbi:uncharacterized protein LOC125068971 [Vanessa atalanta]|uniref:uncharacterized protein LOC125068971 n=1 Tax=Vanessa atalanta TaxID=42275 RepID=UPI001FCD0477|nr:uncharacterized protein LOC125068971 [Vanessa atalanta]
MKQINETFKVRALFPCEHVIRFESQYEHDYVWRQTAMGCMVLQILQGMFHFNVTYPKENYFNMTQEAKREAIGPRDNDSVDIYVKPMELQAHMLDNAYPIQKYEMALDKNLSIVWNKVQQLKILDVKSALNAVIDTKTALLSDYITLYPIWKRYFRRDEICQLVEIDLYSNVKYYFFTSKNFSYKEEFKIGTLRAKEVGLLVRLMAIDKYRPAGCKQSNAQYNVQFEHTLIPIALLLVAYMMTLLILLGEIICHSRNRLWPYIE